MRTECKQVRFEFHQLSQRKVKARFDGGKITSDAGVLLLREVERGTGLIAGLAECFRDHRDARLIEHTVVLDLAGVLSMGGRALGITRKRSRVPDPELRRDEPDHSIGNLRRARQEDAEESDRPQLDCKPRADSHPLGAWQSPNDHGRRDESTERVARPTALRHTGCRRLSAFRSGSRPASVSRERDRIR